ncbi:MULTISPECIES: glutathione S-transferase family protein [Agrobacterium]|uniref:Glutathione S-transferase family protein n=1 Tax=Agrobacterium tumefaciens TaxID=358 RepID=A0AAE6EIC1_AGRTU|nr:MULTISPECIES: glutathione S-transferase family protein [Agrobacterium]QCL77310.1 glutathione S-transferase family protein [Agrobacterium tumefaciens]QCL82817.1 glutathione S-transferase family protein [Agrobacterium tumefaciens]WCK05802.1 glutathione S-transferase family protein [Agrobacterium tumefaciens]CUX71873.1 Glutathione S-transferase [Agrobacterium sp. NCPPB 925]
MKALFRTLWGNIALRPSVERASEVKNVDVLESHTKRQPIVSTFQNPFDGGRGHHRDFRVRWALEEVGQPYHLRFLTFPEMQRVEYRRELHPFGQMPTYEDGDLALFESGAIVHHIAHEHSGLLPPDRNARARAVMWMFAALNTIEPCISSGSAGYLPLRLQELAETLGGSDWLDGDFTAGDLLMVTVLRSLRGTDVLREIPMVQLYVERGEARPAFQRALASYSTRSQPL